MAKCRICEGPLKRGNIKVVRKPGKRTVRVHRRCTAGNVAQRPQEGTGGPLVAEGVLTYPDPPRYRYFMTQEQADRVNLAVERAWGGSGIGFEVIPVPEDQVERAPEDYADLVEVTVNWKDE